MPSVNPGPASTQNPNTQIPISYQQFFETISVAMTPGAVSASTFAEQSFGLNGVTFATLATGIKAGDVIVSVSPPTTLSHVGITSWRVDGSTADKFYIGFTGDSTGGTPASGQWLITVSRYNQSNTVTPGTLTSLPATIY